MQSRITIKIEGGNAGGINAIGQHVLTMLKGLGWSYRVRLPMLAASDLPDGMAQAYGTLAMLDESADLHVDIDTAVVVSSEDRTSVDVADPILVE